MSSVVTFINEKGGVGKTTVCFNIAWELSKKKKILLLDMDGQKANLTYFTGIADKLEAEEDEESETKTIYNVLYSKTKKKDVVKNIKKNLDIIPANTEVSNITQTASILTLKKFINELRDEYDYIFIDVNPTPNWIHVLSLSVSDYVLAVMLPDVTSLRANKGLVESIFEIQGTTNQDLELLGMVFNRNSRSNLTGETKEVADALAKSLNSKVFNTTLRVGVAVAEAVGTYTGVTDYSPNSKIGQDMLALTKEFEKEIKAREKKRNK